MKYDRIYQDSSRQVKTLHYKTNQDKSRQIKTVKEDKIDQDISRHLRTAGRQQAANNRDKQTVYVRRQQTEVCKSPAQKRHGAAGRLQRRASSVQQAAAASGIQRQADSRQQTTQTGKQCAQAADRQETGSRQ